MNQDQFSRFTILFAVLCIAFAPAAFSQKMLDINLRDWIQTIPVIPAKVDQVHTQFSRPSADGERFTDAGFIDPVYNQAVTWLSQAHKEKIEQKIKENRNEEMTHSVQFDEEIRKLALRPLVGPELEKKHAAISEEVRLYLRQLVRLEAFFDWRQYYKEWDKIGKEQMALESVWNSLASELQSKIPLVQTEWGLQKDQTKEKEVSERLIRLKMKNAHHLFLKRQQSWTFYFDKYTRAIEQFEHLAAQLKTGKAIGDHPVLHTLLREVQVRALEAMERMIWMEYTVVAQAELLYQDENIVKAYLVARD
jgi:hypothetical protein